MRTLFPGILFFVCTLSITCTPADTERVDDADAVSVQRQGSRPVEVQTTLAYTGRLRQFIAGQGHIRSTFEETIFSKVEGQLAWSVAQNGMQVQKGEKIAQLDTTLYALEAEKLNLQLLNARREYEDLLIGYQPLLPGKTAEEIAEIQQQLKARCGIPALEIERQILSRNRLAACIQAPISGVLADVQLTEGTYVKSGQELYRIYDNRHFFLDAFFPGSAIRDFHKGQVAVISLPTESGRKYKARVHSLNPYLDESGMIRIRLEIPESSGLVPGMYASVEVWRESPPRILVPLQAVVLRDQRTVVFTLKEGHARWNYVQLGKDNGSEAEILSGLAAGDTVITTQNLGLAHHARVISKD